MAIELSRSQKAHASAVWDRFRMTLLVLCLLIEAGLVISGFVALFPGTFVDTPKSITAEPGKIILKNTFGEVWQTGDQTEAARLLENGWTRYSEFEAKEEQGRAVRDRFEIFFGLLGAAIALDIFRRWITWLFKAPEIHHFSLREP